MKTKNHILLSLTLLVLVNLFFISCTKDDTQQVMVVDRAKINRTIDYSVLVVAGETAASINSGSFKSAEVAAGATGATVQVSVGGKVLSKTTDLSGQATFTKLTAGLAAVTVTLANHTTCNYVVDLYHVDSMLYDNEKGRIASTKVILFPTSGTGMVTLTGVVNLQSDVTVNFPSWAVNSDPYIQSTAYELAPANTIITAIVDNGQFDQYVTMDGGRLLTDITYEGLTFTGTVDASGNYSISVPSTAEGLDINILATPIATNVSYSAYQYDANGDIMVNPTSGNAILTSKTVRNIFRAANFTITTFTGKSEIVDIFYSNPSISDVDYFGSAAYAAK